jgi:2-polyprenyl-6-methoxyphenol hydroxylase-like FAD-dependent oxidoreductase
MTSYDAVVVGGRVAGASAALLLARAGARVAVVERSSRGRDTLSTHGLMRAGVLQLSRWGILPRVVGAGTPAISSTLFHYGDGATTRVSIRPRAGVHALYAPRRYVLDSVLLDAAAEAGADIVSDTTVVGLLGSENGRVRGVRALRSDGRTLELPAVITVGADGIRSTVGDLVQAPILRRGRWASAVLYRYISGLGVDGYEWAYGSGAAAGLIPTNNAETCLFVSAAPSRVRAARRAGADYAFAELLAQAAPGLVERVRAAGPAGQLHGWAGMRGYVRRSWGPGWALVGDAGYYKDPITTHGMTDALRDAELLAEAILGSRAGAMPAAISLAGYQATRDRLSARLFAVTDEIASYRWDTRSIQGLLRRVSSAMTDEVDYLEALQADHTARQDAASVAADTRPAPG